MNNADRSGPDRGIDMATIPLSNVLQPLYRGALLRDGAGLTDGELLEAYVARREGAFFEALVRRHGPMVLGVCQRVLRNPHDAEDAFQAAFLVLAQRAAVVPRELVGNWLYGVAYRTALGARRAAARRRARERQVNDMPHPNAEEDPTWRELLQLLDGELDRLPAKYRAPVVLCHLEGRTRKEAASQLGLPTGTLSGRLTTAMRLLAKRMHRHGVVLSGAALAAALTPQVASASVPSSLVTSTVKAVAMMATGQAATGVLSAGVPALVKGVLKSLLVSKLKLFSAVGLAITVISASISAFAYRTHDWQLGDQPENHPKAVVQEKDTKPQQPKATIPETDQKTAETQSDRELLQGAWIPVSSEVDGINKDDNPTLQEWHLVFDGDRVTLPGSNRVPYTLAPTKQPKEMDLLVTGGKKRMKAIYEVVGARLKLSFRKAGERPSDFDTAKNRSILIVFVRRQAP
jgi:RNA polymerase sigma-70 factor (ECF subfamily)